MGLTDDRRPSDRSDEYGVKNFGRTQRLHGAVSAGHSCGWDAKSEMSGLGIVLGLARSGESRQNPMLKILPSTFF